MSQRPARGTLVPEGDPRAVSTAVRIGRGGRGGREASQLFPKRPRALLQSELRFGHRGVEARELLLVLLVVVIYVVVVVVVYIVYASGVFVDDAMLLSVVVVRCDAADHAHPGASVFGELVDADHLPIDARSDGSDGCFRERRDRRRQPRPLPVIDL